MSTGAQLLLFVSIMLASIGMGSVTAGLIGFAVFDIPLEQLPAVLSSPQPQYAQALMWMNNISQLFSFGIPVLLFWMLFGGEKVNNLLINKPGSVFWLATLAVVFSNPLIDLSSSLNKWLIPAGSWLEHQFKPTEDLMEKMTEVFLGSQQTGTVILAFFSIAVIPAILEEFTFRGILQPLFAKLTKNVHAAIWITAVIFSVIHFQFYGFLPRVLLGALLGYLVIWSGSIWTSVFAHFANNALAFVLYRMYQSTETPEGSAMNHWFTYAFGIAIFAFVIYRIIRQSQWPWIAFDYLEVAGENSQQQKNSLN